MCLRQRMNLPPRRGVPNQAVVEEYFLSLHTLPLSLRGDLAMLMDAWG
jgi:hypothetical protein